MKKISIILCITTILAATTSVTRAQSATGTQAQPDEPKLLPVIKPATASSESKIKAEEAKAAETKPGAGVQQVTFSEQPQRTPERKNLPSQANVSTASEKKPKRPGQ